VVENGQKRLDCDARCERECSTCDPKIILTPDETGPKRLALWS